MAKGASAEKTVREIRRKTRRRFSAEEKIRIVLEGIREFLRHQLSSGKASTPWCSSSGEIQCAYRASVIRWLA